MFLDDNQEKIFNLNRFSKEFMKNNKNYVYKNKKVSNYEIKYILERIWNEFCSENMESFQLIQILNKIQHSIMKILILKKKTLYQKIYLINNHKNQYPKIEKTLIKTKSHDKDNQIILDLYEHHLKHNIIFNFVTFDNAFFKALIESNFNFIIHVYNNNITQFIQYALNY